MARGSREAGRAITNTPFASRASDRARCFCGRTTAKLAARAPRDGPRSSAEVARGTVKGRVGVLVYVDRVRGHPLAKLPLTYEGVAALLDATGIDASTEIDRAFITAPNSDAREKVVVLEHSVPQARVREGLNRLASGAKAPGNAASVEVSASTRSA